MTEVREGLLVFDDTAGERVIVETRRAPDLLTFDAEPRAIAVSAPSDFLLIDVDSPPRAIDQLSGEDVLVLDSVGGPGPPGPVGPPGPAGEAEVPDLQDLTLIFNNGVI